MSSGVRSPAPDRYELVRQLGRGGMGEVFLARDRTLGRDVAIKFLTAEPGDRSWKRLLHEAQSAAGLDHPNICAVHEVGEAADGRGFIVMQFVEGETLAARLARGPLPVREALALCAQVTDALAAAHRHGVVHRDLKPQNVILTPSGRPKLVDFGLAKMLPPPADADASTQSVETVAGGLKGTPAYMSPEQVQQHPVDGRSDLFALGAVLFECLTGTRAFRGEHAWDTLAQILHAHPPPVSRLRPELDDRHDELCRRLLAKEPADRFQSADEVLGALRLLGSDSASGAHATGQSPGRRPAKEGPRWRRASLLAGGVLLAATLVSGWQWMAPRALPPVPPEAARWYERGVEALREGAYRSGQLALDEAVRLHPGFALAHARLAEAHAELDDERAAQQQLLRLSSLVPNESRLPVGERLRVAGLRALVLRDLDASVAAYTRLTDARPRDPTAWFDLGRARESAGRLDAAAQAYGRALALDPMFAAAHLRLGSVYALESRTKEALAAFAESERLYRSAANAEGEAEVLLRRGSMHDSLNELAGARADLERALSMATTLGSAHQVVRARLALSSVAASEGRLADSARTASAAVEQALAQGLDSVAAAGLVDLAASLQAVGSSEAARHAEQALQLAERRGAPRTAARARLQLAAIRTEQQRPRDAVALAEQALAFLRPNRYHRYELYGGSILSRAYEQLDDLERARATSAGVLAAAEAVGSDAQVAVALSHLASLATSLGRLPEALPLRERAQGIRRSQRDASALPYDLANRADLLIRLGRLEDARAPLAELQAGIDAGIDSYVGRATRLRFLRGWAAAAGGHAAEAVRTLVALEPFAPDGSSVGALAPAVYAFALASVGQASAAERAEQVATGREVAPVFARERQYWLAAAALQRGDARLALARAEQGLTALGARANDELRWRLAAVGAAAARQVAAPEAETAMTATMRQALDGLRANWAGELGPYAQRPDFAALRGRLGS